jgi:REP element-mobilizing transposase RayT/DNA-binding NarL/FixJ family response regulator
MPVRILIATPYPVFGEHLRLSLEENGDYQVSTVQSAETALSAVRNSTFSLAILDSYLDGKSVSQLADELHSSQPYLRIAIIPPDNNTNHPALNGSIADGYISRLFYLPDLLKIVVELTAPPSANEIVDEPNDPKEPELSWMAEQSITIQRLTDYLQQTQAESALIISAGQVKVFAGLEDSTAGEITAIVVRYWSMEEKTDLVRYVRLENYMDEVLLYVTILIGNTLLATIFPATMELTHARNQTMNIAHQLLSHPVSTPPVSAQVPAEQETYEQDGRSQAASSSRHTLQELLSDCEEETLTVWEIPDELGKIRPPESLSREDMPKNEGKISQSRNHHGVDTSVEDDELGELLTGESLNEPPPDPLADTRPTFIQPITHISELEPVSPALSHIAFTCLLIPRLPHHFTTGEIANHLASWIPQVCVAYGWRLERLSIRPEYVQWLIEVTPSIPPGNMVRIIRQRTSQLIFNHYPQYRFENPSGDFWAPGFLLLSVGQPVASQLLRDYIQQTRCRQRIHRT